MSKSLHPYNFAFLHPSPLSRLPSVVEIQPIGRGTTQALKGSKGRLWGILQGW